MSELDILRAEIDGIDRELVALIERRTAVSKKVGEYKRKNALPVLDETRERAVIEARKGFLSDKALEGDVEELFTLIMRLSREKQGR